MHGSSSKLHTNIMFPSLINVVISFPSEKKETVRDPSTKLSSTCTLNVNPIRKMSYTYDNFWIVCASGVAVVVVKFLHVSALRVRVKCIVVVLFVSDK